ncbi:MAG: TolC family protein [Acidobacteria bacterium]|nr:TolC family protein [Acidobacteriota bacterium]
MNTYGLVFVLFALLMATMGQQLQGQTQPQTPVPPSPMAPERPHTESYLEHARRSGPVLELTLQDVIRMALMNNLEIAIEDFNEQMTEKRLVGAEGFYDPVLTFEAGYEDTSRPTGNVLTAGAGLNVSESARSYWNAQLNQNLPWGASYTIDWRSSRNLTNSTFSTINPQYNSTMTFNFVQPLRRGLGSTQTRRNLRLINIDEKLDQSEFEQKVADVVRQVSDYYWELMFALRNHEIKRQSLELAWVLHENNRKRVELGNLAPIEIISSRAEAATREQELIAAEETIAAAQNNLRRALAENPRSPIWNLTLIPTEEPKVLDPQVNLDEKLKIALERRPEIKQMMLQMERTGVDREFYKNESRWKVDLVASYFSTGLSGRAFRDIRVDTNGDGVPDRVVGRAEDTSSPFFGSLGPLYSQIFGNDYRSYTAGVRVEIPLRDRKNEMQLAELTLQESQLTSRMKHLQHQIMVEVRNAAESVVTNQKRVETARVALDLSGQQLQGEMKRFEEGLSTNFVVLQYQRDLAESQLRELRALIDYRKALTAFQKASHTILDAHDVEAAHQRSEN